MLVAPSASGISQNQPWSNQKMLMSPSLRPDRRRTPEKWPKRAALAWRGLRCLVPCKSARKVSRPDASTTKRARYRRSVPAESFAVAVAPLSSTASAVMRQPSTVRAPLRAAFANRMRSSSERRTWYDDGKDLSQASANS
jgi:hypothetical protein